LLPAEGFEVLRALQEGLNAEGMRDQWQFSQWPAVNTQDKASPLFSGDVYYFIDLQLINEKGVTISRKQVQLRVQYSMQSGFIYGSTSGAKVIFDNIGTDLLPDNETPKIYILRESWDKAIDHDLMQNRRNFYGAIPVTFGTGLDPKGLTFNINGELNYKRNIFDIGFTVDNGLKPNDEMRNKGVNNYTIGLLFGYSYGFFHNWWFVSAGLGGALFYLSTPSSSKNDSSASSDSKDKYSVSMFMPYLKTEFDYQFARTTFGSFSVRFGYRPEFILSKRYDQWFAGANGKTALGPFKIQHIVYGGLVWYPGTNKKS